MSEDMRAFLDYLCGNGAHSSLTKDIEAGVASVKAYKPWEAEYMQLYDIRRISKEEGREEIFAMIEYLLSRDRIDDLKRAAYDAEYRDVILAEMEGDKT